jgi:glutathione peroxidase
MSIFDYSIDALSGGPADLGQYRGKALLIVNVASKCGQTPQYQGLQALADTYGPRGLVVVGVPCNQFGGQEPGSAAEIVEFCQANYGVTFPLTAKVEVNGADQHPLFAELTATSDALGEAGDVRWNFEKFLVGTDGTALARFRTKTTPGDPDLVTAVEKALPTASA